jgi:PPE-repeat protein
MDFGVLPPEVNSARMYAGPGSGSMVAAAAAWDRLAAELQSTAASYRSIISGLTSGWLGPSSAAMAAAVAPYEAWMGATAVQAEQTASQARAAAAAYETAFAATVPPALVAANRSQLAALLATNIFGQNTAAIAATEAAYADMWAQDAAAMYGYAAQSAAATRMTAFSAPPPTTDHDGLEAQAAAAAQAGGAAAGNTAQSVLTQMIATVPTALDGVASPAAATGPLLSALTALNNVTAQLSALIPISSSPLATQISTFFGNIAGKFILPANDALINVIMGMVIFQKLFHPAGLAGALEGLLPQLGAGLGEAGALGAAHLGTAASAVSVGAGRAGLVGALSVPPSWAGATPAIRMLASALPGTSLGAAPTVLEASPVGLFSQLGLASLAGGALGGAAAQVGAAGARKVTTKPAQLERVVAELSQQQDNPAVQHWHTDSAGLESLLAELSHKPGIHAVHVSKGDHGKPTFDTRRNKL